jgi:hypothetical protein
MESPTPPRISMKTRRQIQNSSARSCCSTKPEYKNAKPGRDNRKSKRSTARSDISPNCEVGNSTGVSSYVLRKNVKSLADVLRIDLKTFPRGIENAWYMKTPARSAELLSPAREGLGNNKTNSEHGRAALFSLTPAIQARTTRLASQSSLNHLHV